MLRIDKTAADKGIAAVLCVSDERAYDITQLYEECMLQADNEIDGLVHAFELMENDQERLIVLLSYGMHRGVIRILTEYFPIFIDVIQPKWTKKKQG